MKEDVLFFVCALGFFDFYQNDIISDLTDTVPRNDKSAFSAKQSTEFSGTWNDQSFYLSCFTVKFNIDGTSKTFSGAGIDDLFCF